MVLELQFIYKLRKPFFQSARQLTSIDSLHSTNSNKGWQLIGALSNLKPSAIFKLRGTFIQSSSFKSSESSNTTGTLGILCEPLESIEVQLKSLRVPSTDIILSTPQVTNDPTTIAQRVALNAFLYLSGFAIPSPDGKSYVEMNVVEKWFKNIEQKLINTGTSFLMQSE